MANVCMMKSKNPITLFDVMKMAKNLDKIAKCINPKMSFSVNIPVPSQNCMSVTVNFDTAYSQTWSIAECDEQKKFDRMFRETVNHAISKMCGEAEVRKSYLDSLMKELTSKMFKHED